MRQKSPLFPFLLLLLILAFYAALPRANASILPLPAPSTTPHLDALLNTKGSASGNTFTLGKYDVDTSNLAKHSPFKGSANGDLLTDLVDNYKPPNTSPLPVKATSSLASPAAAKAVGKFLAKSLGPLALASNIYDLAQDLGYLTKPDAASPDGRAWSKQGKSIDLTKDFSTDGATWHASSGAACLAWVMSKEPVYAAQVPPRTITQTSDDPRCEVDIILPNYGKLGIDYASYTTRTKQIVGGTEIASSEQAFLDEIAAKSGWPTSESRTAALSRVLEDAIKSGVSVEVEPLTLTGPATQPVSKSESSKTTAAQPATGSTPAIPAQTLTTVSTTVNNYAYNGPSITMTTNTTNVTRNQAGDVVSTDTTTTEPPDADTEPEPERATDTPLPAVPKLYEAKYPDGLTGVWATQKAALNATPFASAAAQLMPSVPSAGTCPEMPVNLSFAAWADFGIKDLAPPCYVWDWGKLIIIASALLLARALIFGG